MDVSLDGSTATGKSAATGKATKIPVKKIRAAHGFLEHHETAKIIVVIDTHSLEEDGGFVWAGTPGAYRGCKLPQLLEDCIPDEVYQYLSSAEDSPDHAHKSLILNLACGSTISKLGSRHKLLEG